MALEPSPSDVLELVNMTGVSESEAVARLKGNNNNINQAANEFFDDPSSTRYRWDESEFSSDRDGTTNADEMAFSAYGPELPNYHGNMPPPMSRPPSRANNQSPLSKVIDLTADQAGLPSGGQAEREDMELQRALQESAQEAGLAPQESGIANPAGVAFGPANRSYYEPGMWDVVPVVNPPTEDIVLEPEPADRKREDDAPAFLKSSSPNHRLGALLTIYHEIPLARNMLLSLDTVPPDMGYSNKWWSGTAIEPVAVADAGADPNQTVIDAPTRFVQEVQRLMAFLDTTDRAYGSVDVLTGGDADVDSAFNNENSFLEAWSTLNCAHANYRKIFSRGVQPRGFDGEDEEGDDGQDFAILDLGLPEKTDADGIENLYDLADKLLWEVSGLEMQTSAYMPIVADIIAFRLNGNESTIHVDVPPIWYPDRYLSSGREAALEMRCKKALVQEQLQRISNLERKLSFWQLRGGKILKVPELFSAALRHDEGTVERNPDDDEGEMLEDRRASSLDLATELQHVMNSIDKKLQALEDERQKAREALRELSKLYTEPSANPDNRQLHKYTLCGVSTKQSTTYLRRQTRGSPGSAEFEGGFQWWKICYTPKVSQPVSLMKVTQDEVLEAAKEVGTSPVLVYASDAALQEPLQPLPPPLEHFVELDNRVFKEEFSHSSQSPLQVYSPSKRKYDESTEAATAERWSTEMHESRNGVQVSQREVNGDAAPNDQGWPGWNGERLDDNAPGSADSVTLAPDSPMLVDASPPATEMQERPGVGLTGLRTQHGRMEDKMRLQDMEEVMSDLDMREERESAAHVAL